MKKGKGQRKIISKGTESRQDFPSSVPTEGPVIWILPGDPTTTTLQVLRVHPFTCPDECALGVMGHEFFLWGGLRDAAWQAGEKGARRTDVQGRQGHSITS